MFSKYSVSLSGKFTVIPSTPFFIVSIIIALINVFIKPILILVTLPINILTLGLFTFIINALLFMFASYIAPGFEIESFFSAFIGALLLSILSIGLNSIGPDN